ncbi:MAG TPA: ATP synthase subunit C [Syntrophorhabdaceae bacterium]|nr:ATP synthase subunit C [Syntrophorhabdaceae bacterium]
MIRLPFWQIGLIAGLFAWFLLPDSSVFAQAAAASGATLDASAIYKIGLGFSAAFAIAATVCGAAYAVGRIGSAALGAAAEKPELLTRSILFVALAEGLAVLGFAIAMMLIQKM